MTISAKELDFNKNEDAMRLKISHLERELEKVYLGGGQKKMDKLHEKGKLSARERIDLLLDKDTERIEIAAFAGRGMYEEHGGCPGGGVVVVIGYVSGKQCIVVANDATVKAGAWFPMDIFKQRQHCRLSFLYILGYVDFRSLFIKSKQTKSNNNGVCFRWEFEVIQPFHQPCIY